MTSLRSLYMPHGLLLTTPKAPLLKSLAIGLWTLSLSGKYLQCLFHSAWFTTTYYLLLPLVFFCQTLNSVSFCASVCKFFAILCLRLPSMKKSKKVRFPTRLGGIWISRKFVVYLYREKEILPQRGYLLHFCPIFWVKKGKITRHMRKNMCRTI